MDDGDVELWERERSSSNSSTPTSKAVRNELDHATLLHGVGSVAFQRTPYPRIYGAGACGPGALLGGNAKPELERDLPQEAEQIVHQAVR